MVISSVVWLAGLVLVASANDRGLFYGKNGLSKLLVTNVATNNNCGCNGTWNHNLFAEISDLIGENLAQALLQQNSSGQAVIGPVSVGESAYTLSAVFSEDYSHSSASNATIWSRLISDMLTMGNNTQSQSIITTKYVNTVSGTATLTMTAYDNAECFGKYQPCSEAATISTRDSSETGGAGLDWSDVESVKGTLQVPIYNGTSLHQAILSNESLPAVIYLEDDHVLVDTSSIQTTAAKLEGRQAGCANSYYDAYSVDGAWSSWGKWLPVSNCLHTGRDHAGGSTSFIWGFSMTYAQSFGWSASNIIGSLTPSIGFSMSESYTNSNSYSCNVPGHSVGQVWFQNLNGYGYVFKQTCHNAGACGVTCGAKQGPNYAGAPGHTTQFGCSIGSKHVACSAYQNWAQYSVWSDVPHY